jgi:actin-related protein
MAMLACKKNKPNKLIAPSKYVHFGSTLLYVEDLENSKVNLEKIYQDDLGDGIASMAKEQIDAWKLEIEENKASEQKNEPGKHCSDSINNQIDEQFLKELSDLCSKCLNLNATKARAGFLGTKTRLQPRYQTGAARKYDAKVRQIEAIEKKLKELKLTSKEMEQYIHIIKNHTEKPMEYNQDNNENIIESVWRKLQDNLDLDNNNGMDDTEPIVIVPKDDFWQAGFAGDDAPRAVFPSIVGRPKHRGIMVGMDQKDAYVGDEAQCKRGVLTLKYPITRGIINNYDDFEKLLHHVFYNELRVDPAEHPVMIMDTPLTPLSNRERMCELLFETFNVPSCYQISSPVMAAYGCGHNTAIVVEGNASTTVVAPVIEGSINAASVVILPFGTQDIVMFLQKIMTERGYSFTTTAERDIVRDISQKLCYVKQNFSKNNNSNEEKSYELPDGQLVQLSTECYRAIEPYFLPSLIGLECPSIVEAIVIACARSPAKYRDQLLEHVKIVGGISYNGFAERCELEIKTLLPTKTKNVKVHRCSEHKYSSWIGGSMIASCYDIESFGITKKLYDENGPCIINRKCFYGGYSKNAIGYNVNELRSNTYEAMLQKATETQQVTNMMNTSNNNSVCNDSKKKTNNAKQKVQKKQSHQDNSVVATQKASNTNSMLINVGKIIQHSQSFNAFGSDGPLPMHCDTCHAIFSSNYSTICEYCKTTLDPLKANNRKNTPNFGSSNNCLEISSNNMHVHEEIYLLHKGDETQATKEQNRDTTPMVVFVLDVSGSMGTTTNVSNNGGMMVPTGYSTETKCQYVSRLNLVRSAIRAKLIQMEKERSNAIPVLVTFGSSVNVYYPSRSRNGNIETYQVPGSDISARDYSRFITTGNGLLNSFNKANIDNQFEHMIKKLYDIKTGGCTALGPALALSLGITSTMPGSQIIVCTDGEANLGVGSISNGDKTFYTDMGELAVENGTAINMITLENCNSGLEYLGSSSDLSNGSVSIMNPLKMSEEFTLLGNNPIIASNVSCKVIASRGLTVGSNEADNCTTNKPYLNYKIGNTTALNSDLTLCLYPGQSLYDNALEFEQELLSSSNNDENENNVNNNKNIEDESSVPHSFFCPLTLEIMKDPVILPDGFTYERDNIEDWLSRCKNVSPMTNEMLPASFINVTPNHALRQTIEEWAKLKRATFPSDQMGISHDNCTKFAKVQIQIRYTLPNMSQRLHIINHKIALTTKRDLAEKLIHPEICAMKALHKSANLAKRGKYHESRINLISAQRLLQRSMKSKSDCLIYMSYIAEAEQLDQFMREKISQEIMLNGCEKANALTADSDTRDDDASKNMYQSKSLTLSSFRSKLAELKA